MGKNVCLVIFLAMLSLRKVTPKVDEIKYYDSRKASQYFLEFIDKYHKNYKSDAEKEKHFEIFKKNLENINVLNNSTGQGHSNLVFELTKLSDVSLSKLHVRKKSCLKDVHKGVPHYTRRSFEIPKHEVGQIPESWDWRERGAVSESRNQAECQSCWAFGTASMVESRYFVKHNVLLKLSMQQLLDCSTFRNNCKVGGTPHRALQYAQKFGGIVLDQDYPYNGEKNKCWADKKKIVVKIKDYNVMEEVDEEYLKYVIYKRGPVVLGVQYSNKYQDYKGGVASSQELGCTGDIAHAAVIVGYGRAGDMPYWVLKNSVGQNWGENGFFRLIRGNNTCKLREYVVEAEVE